MKRLLVEMGFYSLEVDVADDVDLDDRFPAVCAESGDRLFINGWMIENVEELAL